MPQARILIKLPAVDLDGDGTVDDRAHVHHGTKTTRFDVQTPGAQCTNELQVQALRVGRVRGSVERRPPATTDVTKQGELRNDQDLAPNIDHRRRHLALIVREDAEPGDLIGDVFDILVAVLSRGTEVDEQSLTNGAHRLTVDADARFVNTLDDRSHGRWRSIAGIVLPDRGDAQY